MTRTTMCGAALAAAVLLTLAGPGCIMMGGWDLDNESDLTIYNQSDCDLDIYVDGAWRCLVREGHHKTIEDLDEGRTLLQAYLQGTDELVEQKYVDIDENEDIWWVIEEC